MASINVTIVGTTTGPDGVSVPVTLVGDLTISGLSVGGGPIIPPDVAPPQPGAPAFPIVLPPGTPPFNPEAPGGYPPMIGGGPIVPPTPPVDTTKPPAFVPIWLPGAGWIMIPAFPLPTPSKAKR
jgi:hypothetical protein